MKLIALCIAAIVLSSCHTMEGVGRDMQKAGTAIERNATQEPAYPQPAPVYRGY